MEKHYADWFERILPDTLSVRDRFTVSDELVYLAEQAAASRGFTSKHSGQQRLSAALSRNGQISCAVQT
nr:hypothetical protein [uncultured bacterium]